MVTPHTTCWWHQGCSLKRKPYGSKQLSLPIDFNKTQLSVTELSGYQRRDVLLNQLRHLNLLSLLIHIKEIYLKKNKKKLLVMAL